MLKLWFKRITISTFSFGLIGLFTWLLWPVPVAVDVVNAARGPMETVVEEEGVNRIREVFVVSSPVTGKLQRPNLDTGDHVIAGETIVATIAPVDPMMLDARTQRELTAARESALDARNVAEIQAGTAQRELVYARSELQKAKRLAGQHKISLQQLDQRILETDLAEKASLSSIALLKMREHDLEVAQARLDNVVLGGHPASSCCTSIRSPATGIILAKLVQSEQVVQAGTPILEIGDTLNSEIAVDLLSTDAININPGTPARIKGWGGGDLAAQVIKIEPSAFTKISALGIEEQRVKTLLELTGPKFAERQQLGHQFRVVADIVVWQSPSALQVPISSLVRKGSAWAVFKIVSTKAELTEVKVGHMSAQLAEVLDGIVEGDTVIVHPSDQVQDGASVAIRGTD
jgi:HlyD family secretion protein